MIALYFLEAGLKMEFSFISSSWSGDQLRRSCRWRSPDRPLLGTINNREIIFKQLLRYKRISAIANPLK